MGPPRKYLLRKTVRAAVYLFAIVAVSTVTYAVARLQANATVPEFGRQRHTDARSQMAAIGHLPRLAIGRTISPGKSNARWRFSQAPGVVQVNVACKGRTLPPTRARIAGVALDALRRVERLTVAGASEGSTRVVKRLTALHVVVDVSQVVACFSVEVVMVADFRTGDGAIPASTGFGETLAFVELAITGAGK